MNRGVLFDLDLTLVDSKAARALRQQRKWPAVYALIPSFTLYEGIQDILEELQGKTKIAVVTSAPSGYTDRVLQHFEIPADARVTFYDTQRRKPHPDPYLKAAEILALSAGDCIAVGDSAVDVLAARGAGMPILGAAWDSEDKHALVASNPDALCDSVPQLRTQLKQRNFLA